MRIRHAARADAAAMLAAYTPYVEQTSYTFEYEPPTEAEFAARIEKFQRQGPVLVCEDAGNVLGYAYAEKPFGRAAYSWTVEFSIYLAPEARGRGIGTMLYAVLERMAKAQGFFLAYTVITDENVVSRKFHESLGYREATVMTDCGFKRGQWHSIHWMEKWLRPKEIPAVMPTMAPEMDWRCVDVSDLCKDGWEITI